MIKKLLLFCTSVLFATTLCANGVIFNKDTTGSYLTLTESSVNVSIESQVASTIALQVFLNEKADSISAKYCFPLPENASAIKLRYKLYGIWHMASFAPVPQDTSTGATPGESDNVLMNYLGSNKLFYEIPRKIAADSSITVELTYVELLSYKFGMVNYNYPNNYQAIQEKPLIRQGISLELSSERTIESAVMLSHTATHQSNTGNQATLGYTGDNLQANQDYHIQYSLSLSELGLYSLSTYIADTLQQDDYGRGFFAFIVEPDPSENSDVINKVFTLIIDRSGSMSGEKIVQAKEAATFIVENLNAGDKFNIISFATEVSSFRSGHVEYNSTNETAAIEYINSFDADGSTNISGAFDMAVPQFTTANAGTANIVIFLTDGEQTEGIINTDELINHINNLIVSSEKKISLFTFGIGESTNERLLTTIANNNNGLSEYLKNNELEEVISEFYMMIKNPVLLNTEIEFSPSIIGEIYPIMLPNLYKGQQMLLVGRYTEPSELLTTLTGNAYTNDVAYEYSTNLSDSSNNKLQFLPKIWAKGKIEYLMDQYYLNSNNSLVSDSLKNEITKLSMDYGVMSPFTSFQGEDISNIPVSIEFYSLDNYQYDANKLSNKYFKIETISPNPCKEVLTISITSTDMSGGQLTIKLIDLQGHVVYITGDYLESQITTQFNINISDLNIAKGIYILALEYKNKTILSKLIIE